MDDAKTCDLLQACEWVAFGWEPMNKEDEFMTGRVRPEQPLTENLLDINAELSWERYETKINEAANKIKDLLQKGQLKAKGCLSIKMRLQSDLEEGLISEEEMETKLAYHYTHLGVGVVIPTSYSVRLATM